MPERKSNVRGRRRVGGDDDGGGSEHRDIVMPFEIVDPEPPKPKIKAKDPVVTIMESIAVIHQACKDGKATTNHTEWGRFMEISRLAERARNICAVMQSERPSGVGR
jgi:hypothetical protein